MAFTTKFPNFVYLFHHFLVPFANTISTGPMPESLQCHVESVWLKKVIRPQSKILLVKQYTIANNAGVSTAFLTKLHWMVET